VYPTGKRTYVCSYRVEKRKRLAKLGRADVLTLDQARRKAKEYLGQVAADRDPLADKDAKAASGTIKELVDAYIIAQESDMEDGRLDTSTQPGCKTRYTLDDDSHLRRHPVHPFAYRRQAYLCSQYVRRSCPKDVQLGLCRLLAATELRESDKGHRLLPAPKA